MTKGNPKWEQFEEGVQALLGLRSTPGSGNQWHDVGDAVSGPEDPYKILADCKFTEVKTYMLSATMLQQWWDKATELGYHFVLPIRLDGASGRNREWAVLSLDDYAELVDAIRVLNGPKRCGGLPPMRGDRICCRKLGHFGHHDNGETEWA